MNSCSSLLYFGNRSWEVSWDWLLLPFVTLNRPILDRWMSVIVNSMYNIALLLASASASAQIAHRASDICFFFFYLYTFWLHTSESWWLCSSHWLPTLTLVGNFFNTAIQCILKQDIFSGMNRILQYLQRYSAVILTVQHTLPQCFDLHKSTGLDFRITARLKKKKSYPGL